MTLLERLQTEMVAAMKAKEEARLGTLRMMKTALKKHEIDSMKPLDEATEQQILSTLIKQRHESVDMFRKGGREDLAANEEAELKMIETYMPALATEVEIREAVDAAMVQTGATSAKQMGQVIKAVQSSLAGKRIDNKAVSDLVKARLA
ncbi:MAG: GatB/YqeY domain-containing protein [Bryobacteraceae bacterium]|nr:GatB/YqeY domain-containing protein [Bryobacteraceae bacterium]